MFSLHQSQHCCAEVYNITTSQPLAQGQTLVSPGHIFELGFFSPNNSANKYVGIWDISPRKVVWVANRENPLAGADTLARLTISINGNLELVDGKQNAVWSTKVTIPVSSFNTSPAAVLLDNGNFVVRDHMGADHFIWQSFDYPGDTMLPNMVLGYNRKSGKSSILTAWKNESDPSTGIFSAAGGLAKEMPGQVIIWMNRSTPYWKSGPWDKSKFIGVHDMDNQYLNGFELDEHVERGTISFTYRVFDETLAYMDISPEGKLKLMHSVNGGNWHVYWQAQQNPYDIYGACGPFGVCNNASASPICRCLKGFVPKSDDEWSKGNWTGGCVRQTKLLCESHMSKSFSLTEEKDKFEKMVMVKVPDFHEYKPLKAEGTSEHCELKCLHNCSCLAYAFVNDIGCLVWSKDLIDIQEFPSGRVDLFYPPSRLR
ncbi:hypothetical protein ABKV19_006760 [Rosa sericea]